MTNKPINTHCPWSGDPVSPDSTTEYRGQTVAFCNPGCRDKFESAMQLFNDAIDETLDPLLDPVQIPEYQPRSFRFDRILEIGDVQLKLYHITGTSSPPINGEIGKKATAYVRLNLVKKMERTGGAHGTGYVILHRGMRDHWLLMHWWGGGDICLTSTARLKGGEADFASVDDTHVHACVWEQRVIAHERDAWIRTMMTGEPDISAYLNDRLADGVY